MSNRNPIAWLFAALVAAVAAPAAAQEDVLPVEQAFVMEASAPARDRAQFAWTIADHYYLYRDRIKFKTDTPGVTLGTPQFSEGEAKHDEFFGDVVVYHGRATAALPLAVTDPALAQVELQVTVQGCHEEEPKICYPPHKRKVVLDLPAAAAAAPAAFVLGGGTGTAGATDAAPLPEEQAFVFEAIPSESDGGLLARFTMPEGYYLYRDKTTFSLTATPALALATARWPAAVPHEDEHFGKVSVYFGTVEVPLPFARADEPDAPRQATLTAKFQGCQLDGICYPPMTRTVSLDLPAPRVALANAPRGPEMTASAPVSEQDRYAQSLQRDNLFLVLAAFFAVGLGLAFTPCVLPMIPILSGILSGAGENLTTRRALWLSLVYVLASAAVFTIVGVIAGLAGHNLQALLQKPIVLVSFAAIFVLLALSMFGFYELQMPAWLQSRVNALSNQQQPGSTLGVAIMGLLSALLVGPCVAPPLAGAVLYIGQQRDPVLGGAALFAMALGMGAPLVAFGASAGRLLPRAGAWMDTVKAVFGIVFLWLALWMLERVLDPVWVMLFAGMLLIDSAVRLGAVDRLPEGADGWRKATKALGVGMLLLGAMQFVGVASGARDYLRPLEGLRGGAIGTVAVAAPFRPVADATELDAAIAAATADGKPVLFDFYADWCVECKRMEKYVFTDAAVREALDSFVLLKIDVTHQTDGDVALQQRFGIIGPPATLFFSCSGDERRPLRLVGYEHAEAFVERLRQAGSC